MSWGGGEKWHSVAAQLCHSSADVIVITKPGSKLGDQVISKGIQVFPTKISNASFLNPFKLFKLYRHFNQQQYDAVVLNLPADAKCAGLAAKFAGIKKIIYRRGMPHPIKNTVINRYLFKHVVTEVIVNSEEIGRSITSNNPAMIERSKIHIVYNGVNLTDYSPNITPTIEKEDGEIILATTGRCVTQKNQLMLVDCIKTLIEQGYNIKLYVAGTGPLLNEMINKIEQNDLKNKIISLGFVSDTRPLLAAADIFVFPSHYEGSANAIVEAMAMGLPVVSFDVSSMPEMVIHNQTGRLATYEDHDDFRLQLESLLKDEKQRHILGQNSRKMVEDKFDNTKIFHQIKSIVLGE